MRLIDADGVKKCAAHAQIYTKHLNDDGSVTYEMHVTDAVTVKDIENAPTVDAVEVVRCKDCVCVSVWNDELVCSRIANVMDGYYHGTVDVVKPDDYCSYGIQRKAKPCNVKMDGGTRHENRD